MEDARIEEKVEVKGEEQRDRIEGGEQKVWVVFCRAGKLRPYRCSLPSPTPGDMVVATTEKGLELGLVVKGPAELEPGEENLPLLDRLATQEDRDQWLRNKNLEKEAFKFCEERIRARELPMKLVSVESALDRSKIVFYFTAEGRVDFRQLVKDLAKRFKARIEMRQIGIRDEAKMLGGLGPCGKEICCSQFMREFEPVSIRMAKDQYLILNPSKISGLCGRLMCCLCFEHETYKEVGQKFPKVGEKVKTSEGYEGEVVSINIIEEKVLISLGNARGQVSVPLPQVIRKKKGEEKKREENKEPQKEQNPEQAQEKEKGKEKKNKKEGKGRGKTQKSRKDRKKEAPKK
ncbi:MAG: stage 0 sporulation protein [Aquificota bacterium]|nr:MAG: stage 0 sporulation protein [Aquificota bacterium]